MNELHAAYVEKLFTAISETNRTSVDRFAADFALVDSSEAILWYGDYDDKTHGTLMVSKYPCLMPPYKYTLFHGTALKQIRIDGEVQQIGKAAEVELCLVWYARKEQHCTPEMRPLLDTPGATGILHVTYFMGIKNNVHPIGTIGIALDDKGAPCIYSTDNGARAGGGVIFSQAIQDMIDAGEFATPNEAANHLLQYVHPALFALSLMHAKNVQRVPDSIPRYVRRRGTVPASVRCYTLSVTGIKQASSHGPSSSSQLNALHLCRGNFAVYTEAAPLFGKFVGTFWRPAHVKGHASRGTVIKDYSVETGQV